MGIAHALIGDPQVLVLDEPANGLDHSATRDGAQLVQAPLEQVAGGGPQLALGVLRLLRREVKAG